MNNIKKHVLTFFSLLVCITLHAMKEKQSATDPWANSKEIVTNPPFEILNSSNWFGTVTTNNYFLGQKNSARPIEIYTTSNGKQCATFENTNFFSTAVSVDENTFAVGSEVGNTLKKIILPSGKETTLFEKKGASWLLPKGVLENGTAIVISSGNTSQQEEFTPDELGIYRLEKEEYTAYEHSNKQLKHLLLVDAHRFVSVDVFPNGQIQNAGLSLWTTEQKKPQYTITIDAAVDIFPFLIPSIVKFTAQYLLYVQQQNCMVYDLESGKQLRKILCAPDHGGGSNFISKLELLPQSRIAVINNVNVDQGVYVYSLKTGEALKEITDPKNMSFSPGNLTTLGGNFLFASTKNIQVWCAATLKKMRELSTENSVNFLVPVDQDHVASQSGGDTFQVWNTQTGKSVIQRKVLSPPFDPNASVQVASDGKTITYLALQAAKKAGILTLLQRK